MVMNAAKPPTTLEIGSARKTPFTPNPTAGSNSVKGTTMIALRRREKKMAYFDLPSAWNAVCPADWKVMNTNP